jgi:hypothetical protein
MCWLCAVGAVQQGTHKLQLCVGNLAYVRHWLLQPPAGSTEVQQVQLQLGSSVSRYRSLKCPCWAAQASSGCSHGRHISMVY